MNSQGFEYRIGYWMEVENFLDLEMARSIESPGNGSRCR
jgi:hypothetical protein